MLAACASITRLDAFSSDFWNKKDPSEWTGAEIDQLTNKSPWAKAVTASAASTARSPMGIPGMGGGGMGGGMGGGRRSGGGAAPGPSYQAIVRWESAKPILDALKAPLPEGFTNHYVISVGGIPLDAGSRARSQSQDDNSSDQDKLDRLKSATLLAPKDKRDLQPGIVLQQPAGYGNVYFGFAKDLVTLRPEDKEVTFTTQFGSVPVKTKFYLKDMLYHGELAV
ncbi:MAG: hypothetical protein ABSF22_22360 [Bryobacteraceae bacterium]